MLHKYVNSRFTVLIISMIHFTLLPIPVAALSVIPISVNETAQRASDIVLGTVIDKKSYWTDASHRWMQTDFTLKVDDVIYTSDTSQAIQGTIILNYWGGSISEKTHGIAGMYMPNANERLLVMLTPGWKTNKIFAPTVGINQGIFKIADNNSLVHDGDDLPLQFENGEIKRSIFTENRKSSSGINADTFINWLRTNISRIKAAPLPQRVAPNRDDSRLMRLFSKTPEIPGVTNTTSAQISLPISSFSSLAIPAIPNNKYYATNYDAEKSFVIKDSPSTKFSAPYWATVPIVINPFPLDWDWPDQEQMSKWNYYADVFRVFTTPTNSYGWRDGVFDLAGWLTSEDLFNIYGRTWNDLAEELGVGLLYGATFWTLEGSHITEADIALNPAFSWTLDDEWVYDGSYALGFRRTMIHELGYVLGLNNNFDFLSLMNYFPSVFRAYSIPFMDDAQGIRAIYPSQTISRSDLAIYLFYGSGYQSVTDATYPNTVIPRGSLTVNNYHIENVGTTVITTPTIEWYLTAERNFNTFYYIGNSTYSSLAQFTYFNPNTVARTFTVPAVPAGDYYLAAFIRDDGGTGSGDLGDTNNTAFSRKKITVAVPTYTITATANSGGTVTPSTATVNHGTTASFTVTASNGYSINNAVSGNCPQGSWNGNLWKTGAIVANCSVTFSFTSNINPPIATTGTATNIAQTSATLNGTVISSGDTAYVTFDFGTTTSYGTNSAASPYQVYSASAVAVSITKTGLTCNTTYHYRVQASNSAGISYGYNQNFTTAACPIYTLILTKQGTGNGTVTSNPAGINCGDTCSANFAINTNIALTATPNNGSAFGGFSGATDCNDGYITMDTGKNCIATFNPQSINGACGSSNGSTFNTAPTMFLCSRGTASAVTGSGPWYWSCFSSNGGTNASCMANIARYTATASVGIGGTVNPGTKTVNYGTRASFTVTPYSGYTRNNAVTGNCLPGNWNGNIWTTGDITADCNLKFTFTLIIPPKNGACSSANGKNFNIAPTANLCSAGTASAVTGSGPWNWNCTGSNGGSTANCTANINRYTATATAGTGGKVNLSSVTVNYNARASFTVTPNTGYTRNNAVSSNCPQSSWNGNIWTTGPMNTNCRVNFSFNLIPVNAWFHPPNSTIIRNQPFTLDLIVNSNSLKVGSYFFTATLDTTKLLVDTTYQNPTGNCIKGVCPGNDALSNPSALINAAGNKLTLTGSDNTGVGPGNDLHLLVVHLKTKLLTGTTPVTLTTTDLDTPEGGSIGLSARGATVNVSYGLCGDSDGNMRVNIIDALAITRKLVKLPEPPTVDVILADTNKNGGLDINDALFIARYSVGLQLPPEACDIGQAL